MPPDPSSPLPAPGHEPKGSADDLISGAAGGELEKLLDAHERDGGLPTGDAFTSDAPSGDLAPASAAASEPAADKELEQEVLASVIDDASKVRESELDELFAELTKDDAANPASTASNPAPAPSPDATSAVAASAESPPTPTPAAPGAPAAVLPVGPLLAPQAAAPRPAAASKHLGPPFVTASSEWKPESNSVNVLDALADVESPRGMSWLVRLLMLLNRPFDFLPPGGRRNLGYVACVVMASAVAVAGYAILNW